MAEIMGHDTTDKQVFEDLVQFAKAIGMVALPVYKEQPGLILNSMLLPYCVSALELWINEVSNPHTIDKTWMKSFGSPKGPFAILDIIGITTVYNVAKLNVDTNPNMAPLLEKLDAEFIRPGHLGMFSGKGFYNYPNPAYESATFLK